MAAEKVIKAFLNKEAKREKNTESTGTHLYLFDNCIAKWINNDLYISNGGYITNKGVVLSNTTKDRLSKLGARVQQVKGKIYLNGSLWDGSWIKIKDVPKQERETKSSLFS